MCLDIKLDHQVTIAIIMDKDFTPNKANNNNNHRYLMWHHNHNNNTIIITNINNHKDCSINVWSLLAINLDRMYPNKHNNCRSNSSSSCIINSNSRDRDNNNNNHKSMMLKLLM